MQHLLTGAKFGQFLVNAVLASIAVRITNFTVVTCERVKSKLFSAGQSPSGPGGPLY